MEPPVAPTRMGATWEDVAFLKQRGKNLVTVESAQAFIDRMSSADYVEYLRDKFEASPKVPPAEVYKPRQGAETTEVLLHHPIQYGVLGKDRAVNNFKFSRGLHTLEVELAALFLTFKDPIGHRPIAEIPKPVESVKGTVTK
jgi:hypothetical protein